MGYYTDYTIETKTDDSEEQEKLYDIGKVMEEATSYAWDGDSIYGVKWYDWSEDILTLSKKFPNTLFTLSGEGEESGDVWRAYFKNGKSVKVSPDIIWPDFTEDMLT